jgi:hypothetical protein
MCNVPSTAAFVENLLNALLVLFTNSISKNTNRYKIKFLISLLILKQMKVKTLNFNFTLTVTHALPAAWQWLNIKQNMGFKEAKNDIIEDNKYGGPTDKTSTSNGCCETGTSMLVYTQCVCAKNKKTEDMCYSSEYHIYQQYRCYNAWWHK